MRIVAGAFRGKRLVAPEGDVTRPTADRVRQALFDMVMHAPWGGRSVLDGAMVVDVFAGTGAMGLEALSRGAGFVRFFERDAGALAALRANVRACGVEGRCEVIAGDLFQGRLGSGAAARVAFLDPPYGLGLVPLALERLWGAGVLARDALVVAEVGAGEDWVPEVPVWVDRAHGAARVLVFGGAGLED
jgi:16S rRNA (guanine966-N2)-methyltransferase